MWPNRWKHWDEAMGHFKECLPTRVPGLSICLTSDFAPVIHKNQYANGNSN